MELYRTTSYELAEQLTKRYSTSFTTSSRLFDRSIRPHIYAIYGMVRVADEIVDSYKQKDAHSQLMNFKKEVYAAISNGYSTNPIIQAFSLTARHYGISDDLIEPFFESMAMDLHLQDFTEEHYASYIYGSAEVVGLMCLRVFVFGDDAQYSKLSDGARALGSAYQKVNFLRDIKADYEELGRMYFPNYEYETFDEAAKKTIVKDIEADFTLANATITRLPNSSKKAVRASSLYYQALLNKLESASIEDLKTQRLRVPNSKKLLLLAQAALTS